MTLDRQTDVKALQQKLLTSNKKLISIHHPQQSFIWDCKDIVRCFMEEYYDPRFEKSQIGFPDTGKNHVPFLSHKNRTYTRK